MSLSEQKSLVYADACARVIAYNVNRNKQFDQACKAILSSIPTKFKRYRKVVDKEEAKKYRKQATELHKQCIKDKEFNLHEVCNELAVDSVYIMKIIEGR